MLEVSKELMISLYLIILYNYLIPVNGGTNAPPQNNNNQINNPTIQKVFIKETGIPTQQLMMQNTKHT